MTKIFKRFFGKFFLIGLIVILISCIMKLSVDSCFFVDVTINALSTIGIALMIGSIFDFSKNSQDFMDFVSSILKEIIISKNFLRGLEDNEKKKALEMVLTPSGNQLEQCSDIEMYFKKKISESMEMFHTNFKTNLVVKVEVKKVENIVQVFAVLTYRVYKIEDKYFPLVTTFERNDCNVEKSSIIYDDGVKEITEEDVTDSEMEISPTNVKKFSYEIPEELYKYPYLTIKKEIVEKGYDHWTNFHWNTLTPADGITFSLTCYNDLRIQEFFIFDDEKSYNVAERADKKSIDIVSTVWLDKNSGFVFTISDT
ncbi:MAG: hypothetical protein K2M78_08015 [Lachnospiraceae bacterium]|nr:hypothetical protein [Lachnospiraceae bacterium]